MFRNEFRFENKQELLGFVENIKNTFTDIKSLELELDEISEQFHSTYYFYSLNIITFKFQEKYKLFYSDDFGYSMYS